MSHRSNVKLKIVKKESSKGSAGKSGSLAKVQAAVQAPVQAPALSGEEIEGLILNHRENGRKLARSILRRWRVRMAAEEIDSIVDLTLCEAANRYRSDRGAAFMTFFFYHLRGHVVRAVASAANACNIFLAHAQTMGIDTSDWSGLAEESIKAVLPELSLFGHSDTEGPEQILIRKEKISLCRETLSKLDSLEQEVLLRSYEDEEQLVDIARELGYSRCHISRVKKRALERLKSFIDANGLKESELEGLEAVQQNSQQLNQRIAAAERKALKRRTRRRAIVSTKKIETRVARRA